MGIRELNITNCGLGKHGFKGDQQTPEHTSWSVCSAKERNCSMGTHKCQFLVLTTLVIALNTIIVFTELYTVIIKRSELEALCLLTKARFSYP